MRRPGAVKIAFLAGVLLCGAEIVARLAWRRAAETRPDLSAPSYVTTVPSRHMLKPDQGWEASRGGPPGTAGVTLSYRINHAGYRGGPIAVPKPEGTVRVVILGDSSVFDPAAGESEDWPALVERKLRARGYSRVQIINAGMPSHAALDSLGRLYTQIWTFEPDYVLVDQGWSDIVSFVDLGPRRPAFWALEPYRLPAAQGGALEEILRHSRLFQMLRPQENAPVSPDGEESSGRSGAPTEHYERMGIEQYRLALGLLTDTAREIGARPVRITQPTLVSDNNDEGTRRKIDYPRAHLTHAALVAAFRECAETVREVGLLKGVPVLDAEAQLGGRQEIFEDQVHFTRQGGDAMADLVAGFLGGALGPPAAIPPLETPGDRQVSQFHGPVPGAAAAPANGNSRPVAVQP